jgi:hypothetical protein
MKLKRLAIALAVCALAGGTATTAAAAPPNPPPGCGVVVNTPAATTGSDQGQANKEATFTRQCT